MSSDGLSFDELEQAQQGDPLDGGVETEDADSVSATAASPIQDPRLSAGSSTASDDCLDVNSPQLQACQKLLEGLSGMDLSDGDPYNWVAAAKKSLSHIDQLEQKAESGVDPVEEDATTLERYANMPFDERADVLSVADHMAATIFERWSDIAWGLGDANNRRYGVDTKTVANVKHSRREIMVKMEQHLDRELQWKQVYDGMQAVAKLSGGEETTDTAGRLHIAGGEFEYHHRSTLDGSDTKRELYRVEE